MEQQKQQRRVLLIWLLIIALCAALGASAQNRMCEVLTVQDSAKITGDYYVTSKGEKLPIYRGVKGGLYVLHTSKAGKTYKHYIKQLK